jgi:hypothetical protein
MQYTKSNLTGMYIPDILQIILRRDCIILEFLNFLWEKLVLIGHFN